jgi:dolichol-phosphate mannosyltransferase
MISGNFVEAAQLRTVLAASGPATGQFTPARTRMSVVLVIPTYNERGNIGPLIDRLQGVFASLTHEMQILVVDDHSPDGTAGEVRERQLRASNVHLLEGEKRGLGAAYIRGIRHAVDVLHADAVFEMDADFSHQPSDVPRLLAALDQGADVVIGSRYVAGGTVSGQWSLRRRLISRCGNVAARYIAGLYRVHDCTAGFRGIRASVLRRIDISRIRVQGYAFQIALLHAATVAGATVAELPVGFADRALGESKLGIKDVVEFVSSALWIRFQSSEAFVKFCLVGASGVLVNLGVFTVLMAVGVNRFVASPIAIQFSIITNFLGNNYWTFRRRRMVGPVRARGLRFNLVALLALAVSYTTFVALSRAFPGVAPQAHQFVAIVPATLVNYFLNSYWTFRGPARPINR